jgi:hypothetical protein
MAHCEYRGDRALAHNRPAALAPDAPGAGGCRDGGIGVRMKRSKRLQNFRVPNGCHSHSLFCRKGRIS